MHQGDAAADEEYWGGKTTQTQVPAVDSFERPPTLQLHCKTSSLSQNLLTDENNGNFALAGANVAFWALWPISWSLPRPRRKSSETLTVKETWRSGGWHKSLSNDVCVHYVLERYLTLVTCMGESIVRIAQEHGKTPQVRLFNKREKSIWESFSINFKAVVKMENYHRLHATLSRLKILVLDSIRWLSSSFQVTGFV